MKKFIITALCAVMLCLSACQPTPEKPPVISGNDEQMNEAINATPLPTDVVREDPDQIPQGRRFAAARRREDQRVFKPVLPEPVRGRLTDAAALVRHADTQRTVMTEASSALRGGCLSADADPKRPHAEIAFPHGLGRAVERCARRLFQYLDQILLRDRGSGERALLSSEGNRGRPPDAQTQLLRRAWHV